MKIAHISDLHLRHNLPGTSEIDNRLSRDMPEYFTEAINQIVAEEPDLLIVSGDLLDYPFDKFNDTEALEQGYADLEMLAEILGTVTCPLALVHGNHDHPVLVREVFRHLPMAQTVAEHRVLCFYDDEDVDNVPRRLGPSMRRFTQAVEDTDSLPQIHVQHYLVWPRKEETYPHTYRLAESMRDQIIDSTGVRLVLSGHYHRGVEPFKLGKATFATVPAFCTAPHPWWIYTIDEETVGWEESALEDA